jgi:hypothetical protein
LAEVVDQHRQRHAEQAGDAGHAQGRAADAQLVQRTPVGAEEAAVAAEREDAFHQRADELGPRMEVQAQRVAEVIGEPVVLDHARRHLHQPHRVVVVRALVAGDVEHAQHVAARVEDRRGGAGQEAVLAHEMLVGMHERRLLGDQRGADRVRALAGLGPVRAGRQRHLRRAAQEVVVPDRVQHRALRIGQHDHAFGGQDLLEQHLHHRRGVFVEAAVALAGDGQVGADHARMVRAVDARQPEGRAALVRLHDGVEVAAAGGRHDGGGKGLGRGHREIPFAELTARRTDTGDASGCYARRRNTAIADYLRELTIRKRRLSRSGAAAPAQPSERRAGTARDRGRGPLAHRLRKRWAPSPVPPLPMETYPWPDLIPPSRRAPPC